MATTTNYGWTTPDDTALVKDGAAAIRTLGSSVDTTTKALNPETTLGDLAYRSSTANVKTRLGLGTAGQILQVNSGATAPEWAAAPSAGANWSLLNAGGTALTGATTITVSGISGKDKIMILVAAASSASTDAEINIRFNTDTGSNYYSYGTYLQYGSTYSVGNYTYNSGANDKILFGAMGNNVANAVAGYCMITGCNASGVKVFQSVAGANGTNHVQNYLGGYYNSASTISSISMVSGTGNFDAGTVFVYTSA